YHTGRGASYAALGAVAGLIGSAADVTTAVNGNLRTSALIAGAAMIAFGVIALAQQLGAKLPKPRLPGSLQKAAERAHGWAFGLPPIARAAAVGMLTPLLPCGWLYLFVLIAAGTGNPAVGALVMASFWLGTVPALAAVGVGLQKLTGPLRRHLPTLTSVLIIGFGLYTALGRTAIAELRAPELPDGSVASQLLIVQDRDAAPLPCCELGASIEQQHQ
ncbi:MAG: sulfite exporter TauE/SafE family protein, partial [Planctomycetota bacterium]